MKQDRLKGYVFVAITGTILVLTAVFLLLQWGSTSKFSLFGPEKQVNTGLLILISAIGGIVLLYACKVMIRGLLLLRRTRKTPAADNA